MRIFKSKEMVRNHFNKIILLLTVFIPTLKILAQPIDTSIIRENDTTFIKDKIIILNQKKDTIEIAGWKNGKLHGEQRLFFGNNQLSSIAYYKNGWKNGSYKTFQAYSGNLISESNYKYYPKLQQSLLNGVYIRYNSNGNKSEDFQYKAGNRNGKYKRFHPNGNLQEEGTFKDDLITGIKKTYQVNGIIRTEERFTIIDNPDYIPPVIDTFQLKKYQFLDNEPKKKEKIAFPEVNTTDKKLSVLDGLSIYYGADGLVQSELNFKNGKKNGLCTEYYINNSKSSLRSRVVFKDGEEHGDFIYYRYDGKKEREGRFFKNVELDGTIYRNVYDGTVIFYQDNGEKQRLENWKNFQKNGLQETYHYRTGTVSSSFYLVDGLKEGIELNFDQEGRKTMEALNEIVEIDGERHSQVVGTKKSWARGKLTSEANYKDGLIHGIYKSYYEFTDTLCLKEMKTYVNGKLNGPYKTYYKTGKIYQDYIYRSNEKNNSLELHGWCANFNENGTINSRFYALTSSNYLIHETFDQNFRVSIDLSRKLELKWDANQSLNQITLREGNPFLGFETFQNGDLRRLNFVEPKTGRTTTVNFLGDGTINQADQNNERFELDEETIKIIRKIANQYNPEWRNKVVEPTSSEGNSKHEWKYKDGTPFLRFQFKDSLLSGDFTVYHPIIAKDTLFHAEFLRGEAVGNWVLKNIEGTIIYRNKYYPNHTIKESYTYWNTGKPREVIKRDSTKTTTFNLTYYENGNLKEHREPLISSYAYFNQDGDTTSYNWLYIKEDSIRIIRTFHDNGQLKKDQYRNYNTGEEYAIGYFENGVKQYFQTLKNQKLNGRYEQYNKDGRLLREGDYLDGQREGKWIVYEYQKMGNDSILVSDTLFYKKGELQVQKDDLTTCRCYDTSLPATSVGFANSLPYMVAYDKIVPAIPKNIVPVDKFNYEKIYYLNHQFSNGSESGFSSMKILPYKEFSFYYPNEEFMKFNLTPCPVDGYIPNFDANVFYYTSSKSISTLTLSPQRIAVTLTNNPLKIQENNQNYTAYFDTKSLEFDENGLTGITYKPNSINCFPKGVIKDFLYLQIDAGQVIINPFSSLSPYSAPLLTNEVNKMYGLSITDASLHFEYPIEEGKVITVKGSSREVYAGYNYVAGAILLKGLHKGEKGFQLKNTMETVFAEDLKRFFEEKGFFRVKVVLKDEATLEIQFYTEN